MSGLATMYVEILEINEDHVRHSRGRSYDLEMFSGAEEGELWTIISEIYGTGLSKVIDAWEDENIEIDDIGRYAHISDEAREAVMSEPEIDRDLDVHDYHQEFINRLIESGALVGSGLVSGLVGSEVNVYTEHGATTPYSHIYDMEQARRDFVSYQELDLLDFLDETIREIENETREDTRRKVNLMRKIVIVSCIVSILSMLVIIVSFILKLDSIVVKVAPVFTLSALAAIVMDVMKDVLIRSSP